MENLRARTARQIDDTRKFALQVRAARCAGFAGPRVPPWLIALWPAVPAQKMIQDILTVADNMERALEHVPGEVKTREGPAEGVDYYAQLCNLYEGINLVNGAVKVSGVELWLRTRRPAVTLGACWGTQPAPFAFCTAELFDDERGGAGRSHGQAVRSQHDECAV